MSGKRICVVGASGKLGQYMVDLALTQGWQVTTVCRVQSVHKLAHFGAQIERVAGHTDDRDVIRRAVQDADAVLCVLAPWGVNGYSTGTAQAVLDFAPPAARLIFSCGWHISRDGKDKYRWQLRVFLALFGPLARWFKVADLNDQVEACRRIFASNKRWTVVRCSDIEEGPAATELPIWREHVGDPALAKNLTRRVDFARFMLAAVDDETLVQQAPAIVGAG